jgi:signal transduction histidine kinase
VYLKRIASAAGRMDQLTQELLNYSRLANTTATAGKVDLETLVQEIIETYPQFSDRRIPIDVRRPLGEVSANHGLLVQVFSNLLANAAKFAHPDRRPAITVASEVSDTRVRVLVQDNGIGIPEGQEERIFGLFEKLTTSHEGTGIGLAIARKAVERMGGAIGVTSTLGAGSCFWVELPRARA